MAPDGEPRETIRAPDDLRELAYEVAQIQYELHRERRAAVWAQRRSRFSVLSTSANLVVMVICVGGFTALVLTLLRPDAPTVSESARLSSPAVGVGEEGGLLPTVSVLVAGQPEPVRDLRPAVLLLAPEDCGDCAAVTESLVRQAGEYGISVVVIGQSGSEQRLAELNAAIPQTPAVVAIDSSGVIFDTYDARTPTAVVVAGDGTVTTILHSITALTAVPLSG